MATGPNFGQSFQRSVTVGSGLLLPVGLYLDKEETPVQSISGAWLFAGLTLKTKSATRGASTMNKDLDQLKLLGILHTIWGVLAILFGLLFGIMYIGIGAAAAASPNSTTDDSGMSSGAFGGIFIVFGIVFLVAAVIYGILMIIAGGKLRKQRGYGFCFFVAIVDLLGFPSIILGIFTLIVLNRPTVKELFKGGVIPPGATVQTA